MIEVLDFLQTTEEKMIDLANKIKLIRKSKKISQEKLSLMSNVSFGSVKRFEQTGEISLYSLIKICNSLKIKIDFIDLNQTSNKEEGFYNVR